MTRARKSSLHSRLADLVHLVFSHLSFSVFQDVLRSHFGSSHFGSRAFGSTDHSSSLDEKTIYFRGLQQMAQRSWSYGKDKADRWYRGGYHGGHRNRGPYSYCEGCGNYAYHCKIKQPECKKCQHDWPDSVLKAAGVFTDKPSAPVTSGISGLIEYARKLKEAGKSIDEELMALLPPDALTVTPPSQRQIFNKQQEEFTRVHNNWKKAGNACFKAVEHRDRLQQQLAAQIEKVSKLNEECSVAGEALSKAEADLYDYSGSDEVGADTPSYAQVAKGGKGGGMRRKPVPSQEEKDAHDPVRTAIDELVQKSRDQAARDDGEGNNDAMDISLEALQPLIPVLNTLVQAAKHAQRSSPYGSASSAPSPHGTAGGPSATALPIPQSQLAEERKAAAELAARAAQNLPAHS